MFNDKVVYNVAGQAWQHDLVKKNRSKMRLN